MAANATRRNRPLAAIAALIVAACMGSSAGAQKFLEAGEAAAPPRGAFALCAEDRDTCGLSPSKPIETPKSAEAEHITAGRAEPTIISVRATIRETSVIRVPATTRAKTEARESAKPRQGASSLSDVEILALAHQVNDRINAFMRYQTDQVIWGVEERWVRPIAQYRSRFGDCEDFALEKRSALLEAGVPADRLRMAVAWSERTGLHAVLLVRTGDGDFVLDNADADIRRVDDTDYDWRSVQSGPHLLAWARPRSNGLAS